MPQLNKRLLSIDIFRAVTMFFMIFVNDLWSVEGVPSWLDHAKKYEDALGFADTIFPAFLFIVGLSIPYAISARIAKGATQKDILTYIATRSFALLIMGFFHINLENYNDAGALLPKSLWQILITVGFFLIWLDYSPALERKKKIILQCTGAGILIAMAVLYSGIDDDKDIVWMRPQWWGILGLIGWSYLLCATIFFYSKKRISVLIIALVFFSLFNILVNAGWLDVIKPVKTYIWITGSGSLPALTMAGILVSCLHEKFQDNGKLIQWWFTLSAIGFFMLAGGFALRPLLGGISKIRATPSWVMICTGISIFCFLLFSYLIDIKKKQGWFAIIRPAGTSTLTAYLLPYIHYALYNIFSPAITLPLVLRTGGVGIIKSLLYSLVIIIITGLLEKRRIRLKI